MMSLDGSQGREKHVLALAKELLDDIELSRLAAEPLLLKATRLARLIGNEEILNWLKYEGIGYDGTSPISLKYMGLTGRWSDYKNKLGYWGPLAQQEITINTLKTQLSTLHIPSISYAPSSANPNEYVTGLGINKMKEVTDSISTQRNTIGNQINTLGAIRSKVLSLLHEFVAGVYYERLFSDLAESIFENYKTEVDHALTKLSEEVLRKIPHVYDRLSENDPEAISQGLTTCRRIIDSFADSVFPAQTEPVDIDGNKLDVGQDKVKNRLNAYINQKIESKSHKQRLRQTLSNLYDRVSAGVHSEVSGEEARALLLQTYLFVGEVIKLDASPKKSDMET
jgi:hypothetical protein